MTGNGPCRTQHDRSGRRDRAARRLGHRRASIVIGAVALVTYGPHGEHATRSSWLPAINAALNGTATILLGSGYVLVRRRHVAAHRACMIAAFAASSLFLITYLIHHAQVGSVPFHGAGWLRPTWVQPISATPDPTYPLAFESPRSCGDGRSEAVVRRLLPHARPHSAGAAAPRRPTLWRRSRAGTTGGGDAPRMRSPVRRILALYATPRNGRVHPLRDTSVVTLTPHVVAQRVERTRAGKVNAAEAWAVASLVRGSTRAT
jgi:hypothetical protein